MQKFRSASAIPSGVLKNWDRHLATAIFRDDYRPVLGASPFFNGLLEGYLCELSFRGRDRGLLAENVFVEGRPSRLKHPRRLRLQNVARVGGYVMPIRRHISIVLVVAIAGALVLRGAAGWLMLRFERSAQNTGPSSMGYQRVGLLVSDSRKLLVALDILVRKSSDVFELAEGLAEPCRENLTAIRQLPRFAADPLIAKISSAFEELLAQGSIAAQLKQSNPSKQQALGRYDGLAIIYRGLLNQLRDQAVRDSRAEIASLVHRRTMMF